MSKHDLQRPEQPMEQTCALDTEGQCITCSDAAIAVTVLSIDQASGLALVEVQQKTEEIDVSLLEVVAPGDIVLVHAGIAIGKYGGDEHE